VEIVQHQVVILQFFLQLLQVEEMVVEDTVDQEHPEHPEGEAAKELAQEVEIVHQQVHHKDQLVVPMEMLLEV
jgi:hypothetical protein